jgi:hypothetical protein
VLPLRHLARETKESGTKENGQVRLPGTHRTKGALPGSGAADGDWQKRHRCHQW